MAGFDFALLCNDGLGIRSPGDTRHLTAWLISFFEREMDTASKFARWSLPFCQSRGPLSLSKLTGASERRGEGGLSVRAFRARRWSDRTLRARG